jgi:hypothetical protein
MLTHTHRRTCAKLVLQDTLVKLRSSKIWAVLRRGEGCLLTALKQWP